MTVLDRHRSFLQPRQRERFALRPGLAAGDDACPV